MSLQPEKPISLTDDVPGGETVEKRHEFEDDATLEQIWARNYIGHEFDLRYKFRLERQGGRTESLIDHLGKRFLTGDDDIHDPSIRVEVDRGDTLVIQAENDDPDHLYHANARVHVDHEHGLIGVLRNLPFVGGEA